MTRTRKLPVVLKWLALAIPVLLIAFAIGDMRWSGPDITAHHESGKVTIANTFLTEYWLSMHSATFYDADNGRMLVAIHCADNASFTYVVIQLGGKRVSLDQDDICKIHYNLPPGFIFSRSKRLRVEAVGNNGFGHFNHGSRVIQL